jgi:hypothetical protein
MAVLRPHLALHDPDGTPWEVFTVLDDAPPPQVEGEPQKVPCC